jgi:hypothetical protein
MRNLRPLVLVLLLSIVAACGEKDREETGKSHGKPTKKGDIEVRVTDRGEKKPDGATDVPERSGEAALTLDVTLPKRTFDAGEPIEATFILRNSSPKEIRMYQPSRTLGGDYRLDIVNPRGRKSSIAHRLRVREESIEEDDLAVLRPGEKVRATVDLGPALKDRTGGVLGEYRITVVFTGGYQGKNHTMDLWNRQGTREVPAPEQSVTLTWPEDLKRKGVTQELDIQVSMILGDTSSRRPSHPAIRTRSSAGTRTVSCATRERALSRRSSRRRTTVL